MASRTEHALRQIARFLFLNVTQKTVDKCCISVDVQQPPRTAFRKGRKVAANSCILLSCALSAFASMSGCLKICP
jgi:predicted metalloenzyme YecM